MIKSLIFIIILIILISFVIYLYIKNNNNPNNEYLSNNFRGGDGISVVRFDKNGIEFDKNEVKQTLSFTELALHNLSEILANNTMIIHNTDIKRIVDLSTIEYEKFGYIQNKLIRGYVSMHIEPKFFSDSLLDGILFMEIPNVEHVFCKNEFQSERLFNSINSTNINDGFTIDRETQLSYHINHHPVTNINDFEIISIKNSTGINKTNFFTDIHLATKNIYVFIEFSYTGTVKKSEVVKSYQLIHYKTQFIMEKIIEDSKSYSDGNYIYVIRILLSKITDTIEFVKHNYENFTIITILQDFDRERGTKFNTINIPKTEKSFAMDEFLVVNCKFNQDVKINYFVQIEHSEGMQHHKSNIVEFILRTCKVLGINNSTCKNILVEDLHYSLDKLDKFNINLMDDKCDKLESVFRFANPEFFRDELEWKFPKLK